MQAPSVMQSGSKTESKAENTFTPEFRVMYLGLFAAFAPFGILLYFFSTQAANYWPWIIPDPRSAILIGAGYIAAFIAFPLALKANDWFEAETGQGGLFVFVLVLLFATWADWDKFRPYYLSTLIWLAVYYAAPFLVPIVYKLQMERSVPVAPGREIAPAWLRWLIIRGLFYLGVVIVGYVFAEQVSALWPWTIQPLELRIFLAQVALSGWIAIVILRGVRSVRQLRSRFVIPALIGILQLVGLFFGSTPYNWSAPLGILLPMMFLEWLVTSVALLYLYRKH